ncbi:MAG: hypothetical protein C4576_21220 [Desulfobacteraceae bacterium]|nr:MAG: hypothetical protein C4576_21220 [Desulfobacteraceae bacterium]
MKVVDEKSGAQIDSPSDCMQWTVIWADAVDYYIFKDGVLKKVKNLELKILLKYFGMLVLGLSIGVLVFTFV